MHPYYYYYYYSAYLQFFRYIVQMRSFAWLVKRQIVGLLQLQYSSHLPHAHARCDMLGLCIYDFECVSFVGDLLCFMYGLGFG